MSDTVRTDCVCHCENSQTVDRMLNAGARARSMPRGDSHLNLFHFHYEENGMPSISGGGSDPIQQSVLHKNTNPSFHASEATDSGAGELK